MEDPIDAALLSWAGRDFIDCVLTEDFLSAKGLFNLNIKSFNLDGCNPLPPFITNRTPSPAPTSGRSRDRQDSSSSSSSSQNINPISTTELVSELLRYPKIVSVDHRENETIVSNIDNLKNSFTLSHPFAPPAPYLFSISDSYL